MSVPTVVCAPDSFKDALSATEAAAAMRRGVRSAWPHADIVTIPVADGGEGFGDAVASSLGLAPADVPALDARGRPSHGRLALAEDTAVFDVASVIGLEALRADERDPWAADTRGVGQVITTALDGGARRLLIGLGGSATNDGGAGMLAALGVRFWDAHGAPVPTTPSGLRRLAHVDAQGIDPRLAACRIEAACDVDNPLLGPRGSSAVFGPQKGAGPTDVPALESVLAGLATLSGRRALADVPGAGAAGGLGWALLAFAGARLLGGFDLVADAVGLDAHLDGADLVLTGEGRVDGQTLAGKAPGGVARRAAARGIPVLLFAGSVAAGAEALRGQGVTEIIPINPPGLPVDRALAEASSRLEQAVSDALRRRG